jgi:hypothetical protein
MDAIARALADPLVRGLYLVICFALLSGSLIALAMWYRARLARIGAGEAVRREQARIGTGAGSLGPALDFGRDIAAGRYGDDVRRLRKTMYTLASFWLALNALAFGILIWAGEVNRP